MKNDLIYYSIGALLYCPANKKTIADSVIHEKFGTKYSLALCLEDTINDAFVAEAEQDLIRALQQISAAHQTQPFFLPKLFIRVRNPQQILTLLHAAGPASSVITGFIIPKFSAENAGSYIQSIIKANEQSGRRIYMMPIYESASIIDLRTRYELLYSLKEQLDAIEDLVLNIRVGGNDLCHIFGFRRHPDESIHRIQPIARIFSDIVTVYGADYLISGPVWEYYSGACWKDGLAREIRDDRLCGFTGKTVIHPSQIAVVNEGYQVSQADYQDAKAILNWDLDSASFVSGNPAKERMNEYKTHSRWAQRTLFLAEAYGIKNSGSDPHFRQL